MMRARDGQRFRSPKGGALITIGMAKGTFALEPGEQARDHRTRDGGRRWERFDRGLPPKKAWFTVLRQAMATGGDPRRTGLYSGTSGGEVWVSTDAGESRACIASRQPRIQALRVARIA